MKRKKKPADQPDPGVTETFCGDYYRLESTFPPEKGSLPTAGAVEILAGDYYRLETTFRPKSAASPGAPANGVKNKKPRKGPGEKSS